MDLPEVWAPHALAAAERDLEAWWSLSTILSTPASDWAVVLQVREAEISRLRAGGMGRRPGRRMPSLPKIASFNQLGARPYCLRCGWTDGEKWGEANTWLERAHVIDRVFDGLDFEANLRPLCSDCHRSQPIFKPGMEAEALVWFNPPWVAEIVRQRTARAFAFA